MAKVLENRALGGDGYYLLTVEQDNTAKMGQFYMLRAWGEEPLLNRPLSIFDRTSSTLSFLYKVVGRGTQLLANRQVGDDVKCIGPLGNTFPEVSGNVAMVGGGVGIAPMYLAAKVCKEAGCTVDVYFSLRGDVVLQEEFEAVADSLTVRPNRKMLDEIDPTKYDAIFTCGPNPYMQSFYHIAREKAPGVPMYFSLESHMGCGEGICYACTCKTKHGNRLICKHGPIFAGEDIYDLDAPSELETASESVENREHIDRLADKGRVLGAEVHDG